MKLSDMRTPNHKMTMVAGRELVSHNRDPSIATLMGLPRSPMGNQYCPPMAWHGKARQEGWESSSLKER